jgi:small subunit ribosomal protein S3
LKADIDYGFSGAKTTYGIIGVKCWVYRGDRLANGESPGIVTPPGAEDDRRGPRRGPPRGPGGAPGGRGGRPGGGGGGGAGGGYDRGAPRQAAAPAGDAAAATAAPTPAADAPKGPAVKRVRKAVAPAATTTGTPDAKGE